MFLKRIFGKPPPEEPVPKKLKLDAFRERVHNLREERFETAKPALKAVLDETCVVRKMLISDLKRLAEANASGELYPGLLKTSTAAKKLLIEKITRGLADIERSPEFTTGALEAFDSKLTKAVNLITDAAAMHGRYVEAAFRPGFTPVKSNLRRLHELAEHMHAAIDGILKENRELESLSSEINSHMGLVKFVKKTQDDIASLEESRKKIEEVMKEEKNQLEQLMSSEEFRRAAEDEDEVRQIELEIKRVEYEVISSFSDLSRPLRKFERLVSSGGHQMNREKVKILDLCINDPLEITSSDEKITTAEELLHETARLMDDGKIELGEHERRKKHESVLKLAAKLRVLKERLESLKQLLRSQRATEHLVLKQISELEKSIAQRESELNSLKASAEGLRQKSKLAEKEIEEKRANLEKLAGEILGTKVELIF